MEELLENRASFSEGSIFSLRGLWIEAGSLELAKVRRVALIDLSAQAAYVFVGMQLMYVLMQMAVVLRMGVSDRDYFAAFATPFQTSLLQRSTVD